MCLYQILDAGERKVYGDGRYQSGTYYEYMVGVIEESLNNFLADTEFPYESGSSGGGHQGGMGFGGGKPDFTAIDE